MEQQWNQTTSTLNHHGDLAPHVALVRDLWYWWVKQNNRRKLGFYQGFSLLNCVCSFFFFLLLNVFIQVKRFLPLNFPMIWGRMITLCIIASSEQSSNLDSIYSSTGSMCRCYGYILNNCDTVALTNSINTIWAPSKGAQNHFCGDSHDNRCLQDQILPFWHIEINGLKVKQYQQTV